NPTIRKSVDAVVSRPFDGRFDNDNVGFGVCPHTLEPMLVKIPTENGFPIQKLDNTTWVVDVFSEEFTKIRLPDSLSSSGNDETDMGMYICKLEESLVVLQFDETDFMAILAYG
ncbi:hypothetical protein Tco_0221991, partial [Tanacetum coccineum]